MSFIKDWKIINKVDKKFYEYQLPIQEQRLILGQTRSFSHLKELFKASVDGYKDPEPYEDIYDELYEFLDEVEDEYGTEVFVEIEQSAMQVQNLAKQYATEPQKLIECLGDFIANPEVMAAKLCTSAQKLVSKLTSLASSSDVEILTDKDKKTISEKLTNIMKSINGEEGELEAAIEEFINALDDIVQKIYDRIYDVGSDKANDIEKAINDFYDYVLNLSSSAKDYIKKFFKKLYNIIKENINKIMEILDKIVDFIKKMIEKTKNTLSSMYEDVKNFSLSAQLSSVKLIDDK